MNATVFADQRKLVLGVIGSLEIHRGYEALFCFRGVLVITGNHWKEHLGTFALRRGMVEEDICRTRMCRIEAKEVKVECRRGFARPDNSGVHGFDKGETQLA